MNTGWIVDDQGPGSKKVTVAHSSACLQAIAEGGVDWDADDDFDYLLPTRLPGIAPEDEDLLHPRDRFRALSRMDEYDAWVTKVKTERRAFLQSFPDLDPYILAGV